MKDVNEELWKLGVTAKTQHNEVAPAQHELAPIYAEVQRGRRPQPDRYGDSEKGGRAVTDCQCLLHEKPFAGVNGSGKHNNWSLTTDDGINLLEPGKTPHENIQFLLVLCLHPPVRWTIMRICSGNPLPMWEMTTVWEPTRRRLPSFPYSWENSWRMC